MTKKKPASKPAPKIASKPASKIATSKPTTMAQDQARAVKLAASIKSLNGSYGDILTGRR